MTGDEAILREGRSAPTPVKEDEDDWARAKEGRASCDCGCCEDEAAALAKAVGGGTAGGGDGGGGPVGAVWRDEDAAGAPAKRDEEVAAAVVVVDDLDAGGPILSLPVLAVRPAPPAAPPRPTPPPPPLPPPSAASPSSSASSSSSRIVSCLASTQSMTRPIVMGLASPAPAEPCSVESPCWIIWRTSERQAE